MSEINKKRQVRIGSLIPTCRRSDHRLQAKSDANACALQPTIMDVATPSKFTSFIQLLNWNRAENASILETAVSLHGQ